MTSKVKPFTSLEDAVDLEEHTEQQPPKNYSVTHTKHKNDKEKHYQMHQQGQEQEQDQIMPQLKQNKEVKEYQTKGDQVIGDFPLQHTNSTTFVPSVPLRGDVFLKMPRMTYKHHEPIDSVAILDTPNIDDSFVVASDGTSVGIWSMRYGHFLVNIKGEHGAKISTVTTYVDGDTQPMIITGSWDETIHLWPLIVKSDVESCDTKDNNTTESITNRETTSQSTSCKYSITVGSMTVLSGHTNRILTLKCTQNKQGRSSHEGPLLVSGSADATLRVWSLRDLTYLYTLSHCSIITWVLCVDVYYSEERGCSAVVSGGKDNTIRFWELEKPTDEENVKPFRTINNCPSRIVALTVTDVRYGDPLVIATCKNHLILRVFSIVSGKLVKRLVGHSHAITSIVTCYSTRVKSHILVSVSSTGNLRGWDPHTGELLRTFRGHTGCAHTACVFSPPSSPDEVIIISGER
jgi:WD40 repeat protein